MKKVVLLGSLCMALFLLGGFRAEAVTVTRAQLVQTGGYGPFGGVQTDDPAAVKRLGELVSAVMDREPLKTKPEPGFQQISAALDLDMLIWEPVFLREGPCMVLQDTYYPCTENEFQEIASLAESAPARKDQLFWSLTDGKGEVFAKYFSAEEGAAETLAEWVDALQPVPDPGTIFPGETETLAVSFYIGDRLRSFLFTPQWIREDSDGILYLQTAPEQYEAVKALVGADNLKLSDPKTLSVKMFNWETAVEVADPKQIRAILDPLRGSRPYSIEGGSCGVGTTVLTLDGKDTLSINSGTVYSSADQKHYRLETGSTAWRDALLAVAPVTRSYF